MNAFQQAPAERPAVDPEGLLAARVRMMFRLSPAGIAAGTLIASALGGYLWYVHDSMVAAAIVAYFLLIGLVRAVLWIAYRRAEDVDTSPGYWQLAAAVTMLASGLGWGAASVWFFPLEPLLTTVVIAAMGVSGILVLAPSPLVLAAFSGPLFAGLFFRLLSAADGSGYLVTAGLLAATLITLLLQAEQLRRAARDALLVGLDKQRLVEVLSRSQAELQRANEELGEQVRRRGMIEEELKGARIAAEAANMAKDEFLATMSHEIRTPLNGILPILDILRGTTLDESQQDYLSTAFTSSKHLLRIIDDILDYSKIEAGKLSLETVGVNLRELLDSVVRLMTGSANRKGLELKTRIDDDVRLAMRGDPVRLKQVLTNLMSNAIKFTEDGAVTITLSRREDFPRETELLFAIRDTGVGMDEQAAERLFQPFSQADASTTRTHGGTGLGLVICKRLVSLMHGKIGVRSTPGQGSVFWFTVRMKKSLGDIQASARELSGSRSLLATGDRELARRLGIFADRWSLDLVTVPSLAEAANRLRGSAELGSAWHFDTLLIDDALGTDGVSLAEEVRRNPSLSELGVLLLTASGDVPEEARELARTAVRARSASEESLRDGLQRLLDDSEAMDADGNVIADELADAEAGDAPTTVSGRVLLVEDNPVNLHVAQKLLEVVGLEFEVARNGRLALELLESDPQRFGAVIMDCMMPVMDGYAATRTWRQRETERGLERLPVIAMTANAMAGDRQKCLDAGMDDYMAKPMNLDVLRRTLARWINPAQPLDQRVPRPPERTPQHAPGRTAALAAVAVPEPAPAKASPGRAARRPPAPAAAIARAGNGAAIAERVPSVIDREVVDDLRSLMGADFRELVNVYLEDSPKAFRALVGAAEAKDDAAMVGPAHSLKSTSANLGALQLSELAKSVEYEARGGRVTHASRQIGRMLRLYKQVAIELKRLRDQ